LLIGLVVFAVSALAVGGCSKPPAQVVSTWPFASVERTVPKPPEPPRWPLTGEPAPDAGATMRRVVSVKVENSAASRPQTGLQSADVVYESIAEGGITRFNALFQSKQPKTVGPVRSARLSDLWIVPQYNALFFFSGASGSVNSRVNGAKIPNLSQDRGVSYPYFRSKNRSAPHNLYLDMAKAREEAANRGFPASAQVNPLAYERRSVDATPQITSVTIPFSKANTTAWTYDAATARYKRSNNGRVFTDVATGAQVTARNVVVMWARMSAASRDVVGSTTYDIELGGSGRVSVFRDGQRFDGTWSATRNAPPTFEDASGKQIKLAPGNTWFQVIPTDVNILMK